VYLHIRFFATHATNATNATDATQSAACPKREERRQARWRSLAVFARGEESQEAGTQSPMKAEATCWQEVMAWATLKLATPSHEPEFELDNFELRPQRRSANSLFFHSSLAQKPLMDCIALATHTHIAPGTVHRHWAENCDFEKVSKLALKDSKNAKPVLAFFARTLVEGRSPPPASSWPLFADACFDERCEFCERHSPAGLVVGGREAGR
jgi:hypothetical protein